MMSARLVTAPLTVTLALLAAGLPVIASASTFKCEFGDSAVFAHRDGQWRRGVNPGTVSLTFHRVGRLGSATRHLDGDAGLPAIALDSSNATHFIVLAGPAPGSFIETTTIHGGDSKRVAVRSVHTITGPRTALDVSMDYGHCEARP